MGPDPRIQRVGIARDLTGRVALFVATHEGESFDLVDARGSRYFRGQGWAHERGWHLVHPTRLAPDQLSALMSGTWFALEPAERALVQAWMQGQTAADDPLTTADYLVDDFVRHLGRYLRGRGPPLPLVDTPAQAVALVRALRLRRHALLRD